MNSYLAIDRERGTFPPRMPTAGEGRPALTAFTFRKIKIHSSLELRRKTADNRLRQQFGCHFDTLSKTRNNPDEDGDYES
jgi:hypothetical protein